MESLASKACTKCKEIKPLSGFSKSKKSFRAACKSCDNERRAAYRKEHHQADLEYKRQYEIKNKEKEKLRKKLYRETHRETILANGRKWKNSNPEKNREQARRYRAAKLNNGVQKYTEAQVLSTYGTACHVCTIEIDLTAPRRSGQPGWENGLHIDHLIPISKGGPDTLDNARPSHAKCNMSKHAKLLTDGLGEVTDE